MYSICHYYKISHKKAPIIHNTLTRHTRNSASGNGNKNPDRMLRNIDPGMANVCKLYIELRKNLTTGTYTEHYRIEIRLS